MPILKQNVKLVRKSKRMMKEYELDELMNDARLVKKFKSGKVGHFFVHSNNSYCFESHFLNKDHQGGV